MPSQPSEASPAGRRSSSRSSSAKGPSTGGTPAASPSPQSSVKSRSKHISFTNGLLVDSELHGALGSPSGGPPHWEPSLGAQPSSHTPLPYSPGAPNPSSPLHGQRPHSAQAEPHRSSYAAGGAVPTLTLHARNTLAATVAPTPKGHGHQDHSRHSAWGLSSTGIRAAADGLRRSLGVGRPASPSAVPPSPAKSPSGRGLPASTGRGPLTSQEAATWGRTMQAATASLAAVTEEVEKRLHSPTKHHPNHHVHIHLGDSVGGLGAGAAAGGASEATHGRGHRVSAGSQQVHAGPAGGPQQQGRSPAHGPGGALPTGLVRAQSSAASMQQRLQHKFGEEAAAFMLHDLKQVPRALHPLFYTVVMQLRVLPSQLPASLGEAYAAVFAQHHSAVVEAPERKHQQYLQATASASAAAATQLAALAAKAAALGPPASRQTAYQQQAHAQLQQQQRQLQQQQAARQAEADRLAAAAAAGKQLYGKVKLLLSAMVAAGASRLSLQQLKVLGLDSVLEQLPGWGVLFHLDTSSPGATDGGLLVPVDPSLESWLVDAKGCPSRFLVDPRVGHAELGGHYRQQAESGDVRALDGYALGHMARHLVLSETEVVGAERLLLDAEFLEQVFRERQEATLYLGLMRLPQKTEIVSEVLRWLRANMATLRAHPRAVVPLWLTAPHRSLLAKLVRQSLPTTPQPQPQPHAPAAAAAAAAAAPSSSSSSRKLTHTANAAGAASGRELQGTNGNSSSRSTGNTGGEFEGIGTPRADGSPGATPRGSADATFEANPATKTAAIASPRYHTAAIIRKATRPQCTPLNPPPFWRIGIAQFPGHTGGVTTLAFCKHNRILIAATGAGVLHVWDTAATTHAAAVAGFSPSIPSLDLHPSCKLVAIGSSSEPVVQIRHFDSGSGMLASYTEADSEAVAVQLRGPCSAGGVRQVSYSPDGHLLAVVYDDGSVAVWDPAEGVRSSTMPLKSKSSAVRHASFSPDGQQARFFLGWPPYEPA